MAGEKLVQKALQAAAQARAAKHVADPAERAANLAKWQAGTPAQITDPTWYHGTGFDFNSFREGSPTFLTQNPEFANNFSGKHNQTLKWDEEAQKFVPREIWDRSPNVMPVHVRAQNPFDYDNKAHIQALRKELEPDFVHDPELKTFVGQASMGDWGAIESSPIQNALKALGHDSFYVLEDGSKNLAVYDPNRQLKSATGNLGTFDPSIPRLDENRGGEVEREHHAGGELVGKALRAAMEARAAKHVADPAERAANLSRWKAGSPKDVSEPIWYHGTIDDFDAFRPSGRTQSTFVTQEPKFANSFAMRHATGADWDDVHKTWVLREGSLAQPNVLPVHVRANNPFDYQNKEHVDALYEYLKPALAEDPYLHNFVKDVPSGDWTAVESPEIQKAIRALGHDAFFVHESGNKNLALYQPDRQMKSATGNLGTFDPLSSRLDENRGGEVEREHHADGERVKGSVGLDDMQFTSPDRYTQPKFDPRQIFEGNRRPMLPQDASIGGGGKAQTEGGELSTVSLSPGMNVGPLSAGPLLVGTKNLDVPVVGYRVGTQLPEGFSVDYSTAHPTNVPTKYSSDTLSLAKDILGMQVAAQLQSQGGKHGYGASLSKGDQNGQSYLSVQRPPMGGVSVMGGKEFRFADGGPVYQSTGEKLVDDGKINWGNPDEARDFFRADAERMRQEKAEEDARLAAADAARRSTIEVRPLAAPGQPEDKDAASVIGVPEGGTVYPVIGTFIGGSRSGYGAPRPTLSSYMRQHSGADWQAENGSPVYSPSAGTVVYTGKHSGYGNVIDVMNADGTVMRYAVHEGEVNVAPGQKVAPGQVLGTIGGGHLHHEIIKPGSEAAKAAAEGRFGYTARLPNSTEQTINPMEYYKLEPNTRVYGVRGLSKAPAYEDGGVVREHHAGGELVGKALNAIRAWHGSPYKFEKFDRSKIGTGEGQARYGKGIYLAEDKGLAQQFMGNPDDRYRRLAGHMTPQEEIAFDFANRPGARDADVLSALATKYGSGISFDEANALAENAMKRRGSLYEVDLKPEMSSFLDWNRRLAEQPEYVRNLLTPKNLGLREAGPFPGGQNYGWIDETGFPVGKVSTMRAPENPLEGSSGSHIYNLIGRGDQSRATDTLHDLGIPGITYRDPSSFGKMAPSQNFVVFNPEKDIDIVNRYSHGGEVDQALRVVREHHADGEAVGERLPMFAHMPIPESVIEQSNQLTDGERLVRNLGIEDMPKGETYASPAPEGFAKALQYVPNIGNYFKRQGEAARENIDTMKEGYHAFKENPALGALAMGSGALGYVMSPLTGAERVMVRDPYLNATGNLRDANAAETAADFALTGGIRGVVGQGAKGVTQAFQTNRADPVAGALSIAREYAPQIAGAAGVTAAMTPSEAEAAKAPRIKASDLTHRPLSIKEIKSAYGPHTLQGVSAEDLPRLMDAYAKIATPHSPGEPFQQFGMQTAEAYRPKSGYDTSSGSYFNVKPSVPKEETTTVESAFHGPELKEPVQKTWGDVLTSHKGSPLISIGGDRSDFKTLFGVNGEALYDPTRVHAGFKYMLEPNPHEIWGNAAAHSGAFEALYDKLKGAMKHDLPVLGAAAPMGPQSIDSSRDFTNLLLSAIGGRGVHPTDLKAFTEHLKSGNFHPDAKKRAAAARTMEGLPDLDTHFDQARQFLLDPNIPGTIRREFAQSMDKAGWRDRGFPDVGSYRLAATDPYLRDVPGNMIGGRLVEIDPKLFADAKQKKIFDHFTYPSSTYGKYVADVPFVQRHYAMPDAMEDLMIKYNQTRPPLKKGGEDRPALIVHPFSTETTGTSTARKMFEEQKQVQELNDRMRQSIEFGEARRGDYGYRKGGTVEDHALNVVWKNGSK